MDEHGAHIEASGTTPPDMQWEAGGVLAIASVGKRGLIRRSQLMIELRGIGDNATFRHAEVVALLSGRASQIDSDSMPLAFLCRAETPANPLLADLREPLQPGTLALISTVTPDHPRFTIDDDDQRSLLGWLVGLSTD